jgi:hypothetical protein
MPLALRVKEISDSKDPVSPRSRKEFSPPQSATSQIRGIFVDNPSEVRVDLVDLQRMPTKSHINNALMSDDIDITQIYRKPGST